MKSIFARYFMLCVAMAFVASSLTSFAAAPGKESGKAKVVKIEGTSASYTDGTGASKPLTEGATLYSGATITTGAGTTVYLNLGVNGNALSVKPNSVLNIDKLEISKGADETSVTTVLKVSKGSILGDVKKISKASKYEVHTANGVAAIRGTGFHILAIGVFQLRDGQMLVVASNGQAFTVNSGQSLNTGTPQPSVQQLTTQELGALIGEITVLVKIVVVISQNPVVLTPQNVQDLIDFAVSPTTGEPQHQP